MYQQEMTDVVRGPRRTQRLEGTPFRCRFRIQFPRSLAHSAEPATALTE